MSLVGTRPPTVDEWEKSPAVFIPILFCMDSKESAFWPKGVCRRK